jgi:hypothetical protein
MLHHHWNINARGSFVGRKKMEQDMKWFAALTIVAITVGSISMDPAAAAKNDAYAQKKAECRHEAKAKHFGIHWIKRDRWIKNCIAGRHS